jgi:hypothetical protein
MSREVPSQEEALSRERYVKRESREDHVKNETMPKESHIKMEAMSGGRPCHERDLL